jgi:hypothetical protein
VQPHDGRTLAVMARRHVQETQRHSELDGEPQPCELTELCLVSRVRHRKWTPNGPNLDATVCAFVAGTSGAPFEDPLKDYACNDPKLSRYCAHVKARTGLG